MKIAKWLFIASVVYLSVQPVLASPVLDQYAEEEAGSLWAGIYAEAGYATAQAISPTKRYLYEVRVKGAYGASVTGTLILQVQGATADNLPPDWPGTVVLGSKAVVISAGTPAGEVSFDFSSNPIDLNGYLAASGNGRVILKITSDYSNPDFIFTMKASDNGLAYPDDSYWIVPPLESWSTNLTQDLWFQTWGSDTGPEQFTVSGTVELSNYTGDNSSHPVPIMVRVQLTGPTSGTYDRQLTMVNSNTGTFSIENVLPGTYTAAVKACTWLQKARNNITVSTGSYDLGTFTLTAGDLDGSNEINSTDLSITLTPMDEVGD